MCADLIFIIWGAIPKLLCSSWTPWRTPGSPSSEVDPEVEYRTNILQKRTSLPWGSHFGYGFVLVCRQKDQSVRGFDCSRREAWLERVPDRRSFFCCGEADADRCVCQAVESTLRNPKCLEYGFEGFAVFSKFGIPMRIHH